VFKIDFNVLKLKSLRLKTNFIFSPASFKPADGRNGGNRPFLKLQNPKTGL
jgi:hypothetical protein